MLYRIDQRRIVSVGLRTVNALRYRPPLQITILNRLKLIDAHYINADTTAVMQLIQGDLLKEFSQLQFIIPHCGGAAPYHWGRYRGLAQGIEEVASARLD